MSRYKKKEVDTRGKHPNSLANLLPRPPLEALLRSADERRGKPRNVSAKTRTRVLAEFITDVLGQTLPDGRTNFEAVFRDSLMGKARAGDVKAMRLIVDILGEHLAFMAADEAKKEAVPPPVANDRISSFLSWRALFGGFAFVYGTTRAGKTYSIVIWLCQRLAEGKMPGQSLIAGQTLPFLKHGAAEAVKAVAPAFGLVVKEGGLCVETPDGSGRLLLRSFENPDRVLSAQWNLVFVNEGNTIEQGVVDALRVRCAGLFVVDFNPAVADWWGAPLMTEATSLFCSFKDNPHLNKSQLAALEDIRVRGEAAEVGSYERWFYEVYYLGRFAELGGGVFRHVVDGRSVDFELAAAGAATAWAVDFGDVEDPNALVKIAWVGEAVHVCCHLYRTAVDDKTFAEILTAKGVDRLVFETATGGPTRVKTWRALGFNGNVIPARKTPVAAGVYNLAAKKIVCHDDCSFNEFINFKVDGGKFKGADHIIDAVRYGFYYLENTFKPPTEWGR